MYGHFSKKFCLDLKKNGKLPEFSKIPTHNALLMVLIGGTSLHFGSQCII